MTAPSRSLVILLVAGVVLLASLVAILSLPVAKKAPFDRTENLSNAAQVRLLGTPTEGPDSGDNWEVFYKDGSTWEKAGNWWGGDWAGGNDGNIVVCPMGQLTVIAKSNGSYALVRNAARRWNTFITDIPLPSAGTTLSPQSGWLESDEIQSIVKQPSIPVTGGLLQAQAAGLHPATRTMWLDYPIASSRLLHVNMELLEKGERFKLHSVDERPNTLHMEGPDKHDPDLDPTCTSIQFTQGLRE
jgi:hypothetical protein